MGTLTPSRANDEEKSPGGPQHHPAPQSVIVDRAGEHAISAALWQLDPYDLRSDLLRADRPFVVFNEAWYPSVEDLGREILLQLEIEGSFELEITEDGGRFVLRMYWHDGDVEDEETVDGLLPLLTELGDYKLVLAEGEFVEAHGFEIVEDCTAAIPLEPGEEEYGENGALIYSLTWARD